MKIELNNGSTIEIIPSENIIRGKSSQSIEWINDNEEPPRITIKAGTSGTPLIK